MQTEEPPHIPRSELMKAGAIAAYCAAGATVPLVLHNRGMITLESMMNMPILVWSIGAIIACLFQICSGMLSAGDQG